MRLLLYVRFILIRYAMPLPKMEGYCFLIFFSFYQMYSNKIFYWCIHFDCYFRDLKRLPMVKNKGKSIPKSHTVCKNERNLTINTFRIEEEEGTIRWIFLIFLIITSINLAHFSNFLFFFSKFSTFSKMIKLWSYPLE